MSIAAVILAAGMSSRMGQPKQLLDWGGQPLVRAVAQNALASTIDTVVVVTGGASAGVTEALGDLPVQLVENSAYASGQSSSLRAGIAALGPETQAAFVLLGDQPFVTAAILDMLAKAWRSSNMPIIAPVYAGQRGHPVLFDRSVFGELLTVEGDQGARSLLKRDASRVQLVAFDDPRPLEDIDSPEDYARLVTQNNAEIDG